MAHRTRTALMFVLLAATSLGCFSEADTSADVVATEAGSSSSGGCAVGSVGCACTNGGMCDAGLVCITQTCVEPDGGSQSSSPAPVTTDSTAEDTSSTGDGCGNGVLDADEPCDEPFGCVDCELEHYLCNPYNQVGCGAAQTCDITRGATLADQRTGCFQEGMAQWGQPCAYDSLDPALQCADRLSCVGAGFHPACAAAECCTEFCDLLDPSTCPDPATQCLTWKEVDMPPGLDEIGLCIAL